MSTVISTRGLQKRFGRTIALDGLDLTVDAGEIHGFLGPNGAGKSTTIRILLGLARASGGEATLFGSDPWTDAAALHRRIGYVPGDVSLWPNLTGGEAIDLLSRLRGGTTDKAAYTAGKQRLMEVFQFDPRKKGRAYSKGNRQKVALIAAFATPADLYMLDEPTSGLDPLMEQVFNREIDRVAADGATVLLSSHILSEVEELCDRVTIIKEGKTVESGTWPSCDTSPAPRSPFRRKRADAVRRGRRGARPAHRSRPRELHGRQRPSRRRAARARAPRRQGTHRLAAVARGALPPPLRRRVRRPRTGATVMTRFLVLLQQRFRRDRLQLTLWVVGTALLAYAAVSAVFDTYGDESDRREILGIAIATRTILVFRGTPNGIDDGAFAFFLLFAWLALMGGLMSTFLAVRHTRMEEEQGRAEYVASTPPGRISPTTATVVHGVLANVALGLFVALAFIGAGLD